MIKKPPIISIILTTFNRAHLIEETLDSIVKQTYSYWECLIIDDFSTDNTRDLIESYIKDDNRFSFHLKPNYIQKGLSASRNYGLSLISQNNTDFLQFFDDDDIMHPQKLELQCNELIENQYATFSLCAYKNFLVSNEISWDENAQNYNNIKFSIGEAYLIGKVQFVAQVPLFRLEKIKNWRFDEELFYAEEWALFSMKFLKDKPSYTILEKVLFYRRKHSESITEKAHENFLKKKTSVVVNIKIFQYLTEVNAHTKLTLFYFARKFLLYEYDSNLVNTIGKLIKENNNCNSFDYFKYRAALKLHFFLRKGILKILNF